MKHDDLFLTDCIYTSDEDADMVEDIFVGYDPMMNLNVVLEHSDYSEPQYNCFICAEINKDDAYELAKRLHVKMTQISEAFRASIADYTHLVNPTLSQTRDCFKELLDFIADNNCRYKIHRTFGADNYTCF